jgi:RNA polymerase sigma-70 factor (ECF subfamily)
MSHAQQVAADAATIPRAERGSPDSFESLVGAELPILHRQAFRMTHHHDEAQDLVQDTLERAYRAFARFQTGSNLRAWLMQIMRNIWISHCRRQPDASRTVPLDVVGQLLPRAASDPRDPDVVEESVVDALSVAAIHAAIGRLPSHLRQVVVLADVNETPYETIAETLAIPIGTVASRLHRGRRQLRITLSDRAREMDYLPRAS